MANEADSTMFASIHAASNGGAPNDAASLVRRVAQRAFDGVILNRVVLGDYNRAPQNLQSDAIPGDALIYNSGQATQQSGNELDYMVSNVETGNWQAAVNANYGSDHCPVIFSSLQAGAGPQELTIHADNSDRLLDVYQGNDRNGTHVIIYHPNGAANQRWKLYPIGQTGESGRPLYRIVSSKSNKCLDVDRGQGSPPGDYLNIWDLPQPGRHSHLGRLPARHSELLSGR
ncbi:RICIN domain-containing protein [Streptomyces sp. NPDC094438]|uniref:RICIN domain-containing protein n=1 Tax=Streptomyces sp. NPDC094438 TaxID=3366061 RepID=UPI0038146E67